MSVGQDLQSVLVGRLRAIDELSGIFDGPPARAAYPYLVIDAGLEFDWSAKELSGREIVVAVTVWDEQPARLQRLSDALELVLGDPPAVSGWSLATWRFLKRRTVRDVAGPWAVALDYRARFLAFS